eukprot:CAMPEP_0183440768 /NCGR_PEP_ID=MMETSP0370-20130417/82678_1 /TAXON_ID=268820 /ORGANISM="Peridinium aciculiferum, Strain PAER-2" /LENGTH=30 /DNA_ID= /DNA_START= /DNA_END= /DNA_ORIENTATION=
MASGLHSMAPFAAPGQRAPLRKRQAVCVWP